ncbi:MAG: enoyl-CoA hydratase [Pseudomonadota bacterium]
MTYETILLEVRDHVGIITFNRPQARNALNAQLITELSSAIDGLEADNSVRAIVITGSDKAFAAGADIKEMAEKTWSEAFRTDFVSTWDRIAHTRKPTIAAVAGYALGGGCELAMMCDIILAADTAKFGQPEITIGIIPGAGGTQRLTRLIGRAKAMDMILTGRTMGAEEAERSGLVSRIVPADNLLTEALAVAEKIADLPQIATMVAKEAVNRADEVGLREGCLYERRTFHTLFNTRDQSEGMAAFAEKRKPTFNHC